MKKNNIVALEISLQHNNCYRYWTLEEIKDGFNFGRGSVADFKRYKENNKKLCKIIFTNKEIENYKYF